jgi:hypothetical protein
MTVNEREETEDPHQPPKRSPRLPSFHLAALPAHQHLFKKEKKSSFYSFSFYLLLSAALYYERHTHNVYTLHVGTFLHIVAETASQPVVKERELYTSPAL